MVVVMIMPVMMNICHYQHLFNAVWEVLFTCTQIGESIFKCWPREMAKV